MEKVVGRQVRLTLEIDGDDSGFLAKVLAPEGIDSFGQGPSPLEAVTDLVEVMRAELQALRVRREQLSSRLLGELEALEGVLEGK